MKQVLVTGGAGFIGSNFVRYILQNDHQVRVVNLDALTYAGSLDNLKELRGENRHHFVEGNICDRGLIESLLKQYQIDIVVNFAAETHVDRSIVDSHPFFQTNVIGTLTLLEAVREFWAENERPTAQERRFHHISTDEVYGSLLSSDSACSEATPYAPNSPYAASKASSDHLVRSYGHTYGLPFTISNCSNNYGPHQYPEKLIPLMILNARSGRPMPIYGDGKQVRDWLYVIDHCEAIHRILVSGKIGETYNIGGGNQTFNLTIAETLCDLLDEFQPANSPHRQLIQFVEDRPGHDRRYAMDINKINRELGWSPRTNLAEGLRLTAEWYFAHPEWVAAITSQQSYRQWMEKNYSKRVIQL